MPSLMCDPTKRTTKLLYFDLPLLCKVKKQRSSRNRPRWPKGFRVG